MLSARNKIRLILALIAFIAWITTLLSLIAIDRMIYRIDVIVNQDAAIVELGDRINVRMLEARRDEKNFIIYFDSSYLVQNRNRINEIKDEIQKKRTLAGTYQETLDSLEKKLSYYAEQISQLSRTYQEDPRALYRLQEQMRDYEKELRSLAQKRQLNIQDLPALGLDFSMPILSAALKVSSDQARLFSNLRETSDQVQQLAQGISAQAREELARDASKSKEYGLRAQKWILILLIVFGIVLIVLIVIIPQRIFLRFHRLNRILQAMGRGETDVTLPRTQGEDEVDQLFESFGEAIERLKYFNDLKTEKIIEIERNLRRIMDEVHDAVFILSEDLKITHVNRAAQKMFDVNNDIIRSPIKNIDSIWEQMGETLDQIEKIGRFEGHLKVHRQGLKKRHIIIMPIMGLRNRLESVVMFIR